METEQPFYESNLFCSLISIAVGIVLAVVAAMKHDLRWLLWGAYFCFLGAAWFASRKTKWMRTITISIGVVLLALMGIAYRWLLPDAQSGPVAITQNDSKPDTTAIPVPAPSTPDKSQNQGTQHAQPKNKKATSPSSPPIPMVSTSGSNSPAVGTINGNCNAVQGGENNQQTLNCGPPPPPPLTWMAHYQVITPPINSQFQYELDVTLTPNREWEPVSIAVNCSGEIRAINANTRLGGEFANAVEEVSKEDAKVGVIHFDKHPITPEEPLLVRIFADKPVTVVVINNAVIPGLSRNDSKTGPKQP